MMSGLLDRDAVKLELDKVLERVRALCNNPVSVEMIEALEPETDLELLEEEYQKNREASRVFSLDGEVPVLRFGEIRGALKHVEVGGILDPEDFRELHGVLQIQEETRRFLGELDDCPHFLSWLEELEDLEELSSQIGETVDEDGRILDRASRKLGDIRRSRTTLSGRIKSKMDALVNGEAGSKFLQDRLVTIRGDRYVVPLRAEYKGRIPGIIHDQSASGATLYVEPDFAVEMNNQIRQLALDEEEEIRKILKELTRQVGIRLGMIRRSLEALGRMDLVMARERYSREIGGTVPELNEHGVVELRQARHPLLTGHVVANDIVVGEEYRTVIITGPNTGGKTITLKTLGLLALMARVGLNLPCVVGSRMAVFSRVFADIGDEQSIEQSLSTYSSHMTNIIRILRESDSRSLVLLDELGAGTDPSEGAALAVSLLEQFHSRGLITVATTHYGELKAFAYNHDGVNNASVEFDNDSLAPTYRLLMGTPGLSNALTIAGKLGLDEQVIRRAKEYISGEELQISGMIQDLESKRKEAGIMKNQADELQREVIRLREELSLREREVEEKGRDALEKAYREAQEVMTQAQREAERIIGELRTGLEEGHRDRGLELSNRSREKLREQKSRLQDGGEQFARPRSVPKNLMPGETVLVRSLGQKGSVLAPPDNKGEVSVQVGIMKITVPLEDLKREQKVQAKQERARYVSMGAEKGRDIRPELDLRGMTAQEALERLDKYLDDALLAGLDQVRIIHGKGTGALRKAVQDSLREHARIKSFREGESGEGGSGVSVAVLKG